MMQSPQWAWSYKVGGVVLNVGCGSEGGRACCCGFMDRNSPEGVCCLTSLLCAVIGSSFVSYLEAFKPFLIQGLKKIDEYQVRI